MTLEEFLATTARRLPTAAELMSVCDELGIRFGATADGRPAVKYGGDLKEEAQALVGILRREPWRTQVITAKGLGAPPVAAEPEPEPEPFRGRVWLWRFGQTYRECRGDGGPDWHPVGAWWWKSDGETAWRAVPGREECAAGYDPPEVK